MAHFFRDVLKAFLFFLFSRLILMVLSFHWIFDRITSVHVILGKQFIYAKISKMYVILEFSLSFASANFNLYFMSFLSMCIVCNWFKTIKWLWHSIFSINMNDVWLICFYSFCHFVNMILITTSRCLLNS